LDFKELKNLFSTKKIKLQKGKFQFDKFYNDYTKIYPLAGGLSKTAHLKNILSKREFVSLDGVNKVKKFLENPPKKIKFLDANFCIGGCIGGPCINSSLPIFLRKAKIKKYLKKQKKKIFQK
jgi:iron only hydrogenase large subunit-like protein